MAPPRRNVGSGGPPRKNSKSQSTPAAGKATAAAAKGKNSRLKTAEAQSGFGEIQHDKVLPPISSLPPGDRISTRVPMAFRSSLKGRANFQYAADPEPFKKWISEWMQGIDRTASPFSSDDLHKLSVQVDWRLLSNSGMEPGLIRPVLGAGGWPVIPGSSIKGMFLRACNVEQKKKWCGWSATDKETIKDSLRFHGAWPAATKAAGEAYAQWCNTEGNLLDLTHPQQNWQCGETWGNESHSAYSLVSLFKPELMIAISSRRILEDNEWNEIDDILRKALVRGIGGRTAAGYGSGQQVNRPADVGIKPNKDNDVVFQCDLEGQGMASVLLSQQPELRPTMFRAAIRGMALRLFGGLTTGEKAHAAVDQLFGGIGGGKPQVGLLAMSYRPSFYEWGRAGNYAQPVYFTQGTLSWQMTSPQRPLEPPERDPERDSVITLLAQLHGLVMALGGFGKCWRRPDHRIFLKKYRTFPIGCHWQWRKPSQDLNKNNPLNKALVRNRDELATLISSARQTAGQWLKKQGLLTPGLAPWREVIHPERMLIWTRVADGPEDAMAIHWFHRDANDPSNTNNPLALKLTPFGGGQYEHYNRTRLRVGTVWNRMLPMEIGERVDASPTRIPQQEKPQSNAAAFDRVKSNQQTSGSTSQRSDRSGQFAPSTKKPPPEPMKSWEGNYLESFTLFVKNIEHTNDLVEAMDSLSKEEHCSDDAFKRLIW